MARAIGTMLGLHLQYAQREAQDDVGRVITGAVLLVLGTMLLFIALLVGHVALVIYLRHLPGLDTLRAALVVGGGDLLVALMALLAGRSRLKRPVLEQTRSLVKQTVSSLAQL